ncbi:MAG: DNA adenine methylase [Anaerolineales bacterium]|nr:DNA adenine methylase [Anaerolineales bacterium]MCB8952874.1 DNA adenine methylase [Ardenticatenales bacterium]
MASSKDKMFNSPIRWVGGKSRLRKHIIPLIPPHTCYVEVFAGAAWVLFGKAPSPVEILNDIDQELINFFRILKSEPEELIRSFEWELVSRSEFERLAQLDPATLSEMERAHRFYYLIMAGWGGELDYPRFQTSISDGGHGNRLIGALKHLRQRIQPAYERLRTVIIENLSWEDCIDRYDRAKVFMYLDPPYPQNGCNYKHNMQDWEDHRKLAMRLSRTKCKWMLSSYDMPEIHQMYDGYNIVPIQSFSGMNTKKNGAERVVNREVLITNFDTQTNNLLYPQGGLYAIQQPLLKVGESPERTDSA